MYHTSHHRPTQASEANSLSLTPLFANFTLLILRGGLSMSVRPNADGTPRENCLARAFTYLQEAAVEAVRRHRKRRERRRLREEQDGAGLVVRRTTRTVTNETHTSIGEVTLVSGQRVPVSSCVMMRPTFRERCARRYHVTLRQDASCIGTIEIYRGQWLPRPPLGLIQSTVPGDVPPYDAEIQRAVVFLLKKCA